MLRISFLGPAGTNTHSAALEAFPVGIHIHAPTIPAVFSAVESGHADHGVVPIENSIEGGVSFTLNCLLESSLSISREMVNDIEHCLLSDESDLKDVLKVYSHPQALAQCRKWLTAKLPNADLIPWASTAGAALEVKGKAHAAAIASEYAAGVHEVSVLARRIQDQGQNVTRFIVISKTDAERTGLDKTSIAFSTRHEKGALLHALAVFDVEGINLTRIESRPLPGEQLWQYAFFVDLEGHRTEPHVMRALTKLRQLIPDAGMLKTFGSYPQFR